ncbi:hypothetical protein NDU88_003375 [Pleurodeles waltl]|uniref:Uncharacterized protein n=1 Tax=Pleurodeles waltl TaxID=8319 RepID=A0AAV7VGE3_PLEWA|nr:hypothetical protein NDU88_003375 [Pleurodeles waltl]
MKRVPQESEAGEPNVLKNARLCLRSTKQALIRETENEYLFNLRVVHAVDKFFLQRRPMQLKSSGAVGEGAGDYRRCHERRVSKHFQGNLMPATSKRFSANWDTVTALMMEHLRSQFQNSRESLLDNGAR